MEVYILRDYQQAAVEATYDYLRKKTGNPAIVIPTAGGKCLGRGTPVLMHDGHVKAVEDIEIGDMLIGPDSQPRLVMALGRGREMMYRITPIKGDSYVVNESHILSLKLTPESAGDSHETVNLSVRSYLVRNKTFKHRAKGWRAAVDFAPRPVSIDPYFLGLWLADGDSDRTTISKPDIEVMDCVTSIADSFGMHVKTTYGTGGCPRRSISPGMIGAKKSKNGLKELLKASGLLNNKHIPHEYLANSREVRLQILAGLIDGDGCVTKSSFDFSSTNERIADGVCFLARSLGMAAYKTARETRCQTGAFCHSFRISISGDCRMVPTKIKRRTPAMRKMNKDILVHAIKVEPIGIDDYFGFEIDGDHLFLLGDFTVTHNTPILATMCRDTAVEWGGRALVLAHVKELLVQSVEKLKLICPELDVGVYSAGLKSRDTTNAVIVAGIQSVHSKADQLGRFDMVFVDECFTGGTLVSTPGGDRRIDELRTGDTVLNAFGTGTVKAVSQRKANELYGLDFSDGSYIECTGNHPFFTERGWTTACRLLAGEVSFGVEAVPALRQGVLSGSMDLGERNRDGNQGALLEQASMLLSILLEEAEEPNEQPSVPYQDAGDAKGDSSQANQAGRQRAASFAAATCNPACVGGGLGIGVCGRGRAGKGHRIFDQLQDRHRKPESKNRDRVGRRITQQRFAASIGPKERPSVEIVRVVSVSRVQRQSPTSVFNIHVSGHPSYFANGRLVHNCHLIPKGGDGMYIKFLGDLLQANPDMRVVGLTATPYRTGSGMICGRENILTEVCYEVGVRELMARRFISQIISKCGDSEVSMAGVKILAGEYEEAGAAAAFMVDEVVRSAVAEVLWKTNNRKSILIFCQSIAHAEVVRNMIDAAMPETTTALVTGSTPAAERDFTLKQFKTGKIRYLVNVGVLSTGFDAPIIDCVVLLRATASPGLYYQMIGRGFRLAANKPDCLVLDFGENIRRHGPVDMIRGIGRGAVTGRRADVILGKMCPECRSVGSITMSVCLDCDYVFPRPEMGEASHAATASDGVAVSGDGTIEEWYDVQYATYTNHVKKGSDSSAPETLKVSYKTKFRTVSEWVCVEHEGGTRARAEKWWNRRAKVPCPFSAIEAADFGEQKMLVVPTRIRVKDTTGKPFPKITDYELADVESLPDVEIDVDGDGLTALDREAMNFMDGIGLPDTQPVPFLSGGGHDEFEIPF